MRIIAGTLKGRELKEPRGHKTHPMSEKMRGALFNALGDLDGLNVLDAYAGIGAVGIEAISRGAAKVEAVEIDSDAFKVLKTNRDALVDKNIMQIHRANIASWLDNYDGKFNVIIADPPYDHIKPDQLNSFNNFLLKGGLLILSLPADYDYKPPDMEILQEKQHGDAKLLFYKH